MADLGDTGTADQETSEGLANGFVNDGSFLEQFRKLQEQKKSMLVDIKPEKLVQPAPIKLHVCARKKPAVRVLSKKSVEVKKAFDGENEEELNTEPGKETEATPAVCGLMLPATGGRLTAETGTDPLPEVGTRKRKSRWSDAPPEKTATTGTQPEVVTLTSEGTPTGLNEEQHQQLLEQIEINRIVAEIRAARQKRGNKYDYDSDEEVENGTWEHRLRAKEMIETEERAKLLTEGSKGKHHIGDFLPPEELEKFVEKVQAKKEGREADISDYKTHKLADDNIGYKMLQKAGWKEGSGLGTTGTGIVAPINKGRQSFDQSGLGTELPGEVDKDDDAFTTYRKRMMLAYRFRPNPLNNPRRPYY